jgi:hypothetical protein
MVFLTNQKHYPIKKSSMVVCRPIKIIYECVVDLSFFLFPNMSRDRYFRARYVWPDEDEFEGDLGAVVERAYMAEREWNPAKRVNSYEVWQRQVRPCYAASSVYSSPMYSPVDPDYSPVLPMNLDCSPPYCPTSPAYSSANPDYSKENARAAEEAWVREALYQKLSVCEIVATLPECLKNVIFSFVPTSVNKACHEARVKARVAIACEEWDTMRKIVPLIRRSRQSVEEWPRYDDVYAIWAMSINQIPDVPNGLFYMSKPVCTLASAFMTFMGKSCVARRGGSVAQRASMFKSFMEAMDTHALICKREGHSAAFLRAHAAWAKGGMYAVLYRERM